MQIVPTAVDFIGNQKRAKTDQRDLGQADFLRLMTEQLRNQDPLKPLDSNQFLGQLAQFSTVQGIQGLQSSFNSFASAQLDDQALQAASLIDRTAMVSSSTFQLAEGGSLRGETQAPATGRVEVEITNASGEVVRRMTVEANGPGKLPLNWDGITDAGEQAPAGVYRISARMNQNNTSIALETQVEARIESVSFSPGGLILNLVGGGSIPFAAVRRIG
ncbi:flagellar hook assembly protein FlgD [Pseudomarimonas salicorniae]|uniref:Basal-body rod modification protein FlgD n=1 Tax=Pseudomarimonas salicorniae TaxID=2933270 RepID=A0ABT0GLR1_9GAMM|nr:flagellar hook capping FlgD N-terminal domain-containing protein [Lysobacter sp. CAU 1642]MCK7595169.1 flagellar hook assembly protein FlgD [Lysobacter sp. CAU 1642]